MDTPVQSPVPSSRVAPLLAAFAALACAPAPVSAAGAPEAACPGPHPREFWEAVVRNSYAVPAGLDPAALLDELQPCLASPDPKLRDDLAYSVTAAWIYRDKRLADAELRRLLTAWVANLQAGVGETGTDTVLRRSFSALCLSVVAARDDARPFLEAAEFRALLGAALAYLAAEKDLRGFDAEKGWIHATAHTADLLKFLGRSPRLEPADQGRILDAVAARIDTAGRVFTHGENERLARAVASLARRRDLDADAFQRWLGAFAAAGKQLWAAPAIDPRRLDAHTNGKDLLRSLYVELSLDARPEPAMQAARGRVLECLRELGG
jgi:hypothetical protein